MKLTKSYKDVANVTELFDFCVKLYLSQEYSVTTISRLAQKAFGTFVSTQDITRVVRDRGHLVHDRKTQMNIAFRERERNGLRRNNVGL